MAQPAQTLLLSQPIGARMARVPAKPTDQDIQIYTAGTVTLPPNYPAVAILTETETTFGDKVLHVEHADSPGQTSRYLLQRDDVSAIRLAKDGVLDPRTDEWLLGARAREKSPLPTSADGKSYGIAYVREQVGVIRQVQTSLTAGEIAAMGSPCEG